jgi:hypothetical protein
MARLRGFLVGTQQLQDGHRAQLPPATPVLLLAGARQPSEPLAPEAAGEVPEEPHSLGPAQQHAPSNTSIIIPVVVIADADASQPPTAGLGNHRAALQCAAASVDEEEWLLLLLEQLGEPPAVAAARHSP